MATLDALVKAAIKKDVYPIDLVETITLNKNRRGWMVDFKINGVRRTGSVCRFISIEPDTNMIIATIKSKLVPSEKSQIRAIDLKSFGKANG